LLARRFYPFGFFSYMMLDQFIWMVYLLRRGYSMGQVGIAMTGFQAMYLVCNIPSSYLADRFGRRPFLVLAPLFKTASAFLFLNAGSLGVVVAGTALTGIAYAFISGADYAYFHDTLVATGEEMHVHDRLSRYTSLQALGTAIGGLAGGFIALYSFRALYLAEAAVSATTAVAALLLPRVRRPLEEGEPARAGEKALEAGTVRRPTGRGPYAPVVTALTAIGSARAGVAGQVTIIAVSAMLFALGQDYMQPALASWGMDTAGISLAFALGNLASIAGNRTSPRLPEEHRRRIAVYHPLLYGAVLLLQASAALVPQDGRVVVALVGLLCARFVGGLSSILLSARLLVSCPPHLKATLLSTADTGSNFLVALAFPLLGLVSDRWGAVAPFLAVSAMALVEGIVLAAAGVRKTTRT